MELEEWEKDGVPFGPCDEGTAEECYTERVNSALGGDVNVAATLLRLASMYISEGKPMPKPLADYMANILAETACEGAKVARKPNADKRARRIVKILHLNFPKTTRHNSEQEKKRKRATSIAQIYMHKQIKWDGVSKYAAARQAAKEYPDAVKSFSNDESTEKDNRIKAYIALYERSHIDLDFVLEAAIFLGWKEVAVKKS